ncbi:MAG: MFS transporter [Betaproteobacteria bacterium]|nr:MFS transporter [Betaproteobacteria bacterium]MDH3437562.1 MFS transporter [Betaproteobacteria bacterium]
MSSIDRPLSPIRLILLMCGAEIFSMSGFAAYTTLLPALQREWALSNSEAGLISGIFFAGYVVVTPVLTSLTDHVDARRIYLFACLLSMLGAAGFVFLADGLITALFFQFLIGAGLGGSYMPGLKMLTDQLEGSLQSRGVAFYTSTFGIGSSISIYLCGLIGGAFGWHSAFVFGAVGPVLAAFLVNVFMPRGRTRSADHPPQALLDFRPVLKNRATLAYVAGYSAHNYELFGQRSWMVAFLVFTASLQPADAPMLISAATLAAIINMLGPVMSISGNELALRFGRTRVIFTFMTASGLVACVLGYTAALPWILVFLLMGVHYGLMLGDSAALTAGAIASAHPDQRGASMAVYSFVGFSSAFFAPLIFGVVLDLAGGNRNLIGWGLAFASIGIFGALSPIVRWLYRMRRIRGV